MIGFHGIMRVAVNNLHIISCTQFIFKFTNLFTIANLLLRIVTACSPPNTLDGGFSIRESSILERADLAKIIIVGSVVGLKEDRFRSVTARIAVHVKLKGENVSRIINVSGFNTHRQKKNIFRSDSLLDCTGTHVELYGTYIFFLKLNRHNKLAYRVDEIAMQPAVVQIPCNRHYLSKDILKMLKNYRRMKSNDIQCFITTRSRTRTTKKCLRRKIFWKILHKFTHDNVRTRTLYCSLRNISSRKTSIRLHDNIPTARTLYKRKQYKKILLRKKRHFNLRNLDTISLSSSTTQQQKRTFKKLTNLLKTVDGRDLKLIPKGRLLRRKPRGIDDRTSSNNSRTIYLSILTVITCTMTAILLTY